MFDSACRYMSDSELIYEITNNKVSDDFGIRFFRISHDMFTDTLSSLWSGVFHTEPCSSVRLCGISSRFRLLSPGMGQVPHALLTRPPLSHQTVIPKESW